MKRNQHSKALAANLAKTQLQEIAIPVDHQHFIDLSESHWGIHKRAKEFVLEYNHAYSNRQEVTKHWRQVLLGDMWFYNSLREAENAFTTLIDIAKGLLGSDIRDHQRERIIETLLELIEKLSEQENVRERIINKCLDIFKDNLDHYELAFIHNSRYFQTCLARNAQLKQFATRVYEVTRAVLQKCISYWESTSNIENWFQQKKALFSRDYQQELSSMGEPFFSELRDKINHAEKWPDLIELPSFNDIARHFRQAVDQFDIATEKIYFISYLMQLPGMNHLQDELLLDINRLLKTAHGELSKDQIRSFLGNLLGLFQQYKIEHVSTLMDCFLTLGKQIIDTKDQSLIGFYEKKLIEFGFVTPGEIHITEDWQVEVNTNHIKNIRTWLELIELDPPMMRRLMSALIINLRLGGVFIRDDDLFQRDVTKLLNSDIAPLYKQIRQLCRIFPVYFRDIGCEGELRDLTTSIDELSLRHDKLIHFLRKQTHAESNSSHIELVRKILRFWSTGSLDHLKDSIPMDVLSSIDTNSEWCVQIIEIVRQLCEQKNQTPEELLDAGSKELETSLTQVSTHNARDEKRLKYLVRIYELLREKYSFEVSDITKILRQYTFFVNPEITKLARLMAGGATEKALKQVYRFIGHLNAVILDPKLSEAWESIYRKRHIAAGIPSLYGQYYEHKFEALGLAFRLEKIASRLIEQMIQDINLDCITMSTLRRIHRVLALFQEGLELSGISSQELDSNLQMLNYSLRSASFSLGQYVNIFQFLQHDVQKIINEYFLRIYDEPLRIIVPQLVGKRERYSDTETKKITAKLSEKFYREVLSSAFLVQSLDSFISNIINSLNNTLDSYSVDVIQKLFTYDPQIIISPLHEQTPKLDNQVFLGAKAYFLKKLYSLGFPVPPGFILTTELFRRLHAIRKHPQMSREVEEIIRSYVSKLEKATGRQFGNPEVPLLLSVRAGTSISMPGAMNTFLNVGMNDEITETLCLHPGFDWAAWDCYRRFLQSWGMAHGLEREVFDEIVTSCKSRYGVIQKDRFTPEQMKEIAYEYKRVLDKHDVRFYDDPFLQLRQALYNVSTSWNSDRTKTYREYLQIDDEWGTAAIVQKMVFGNINSKSGSGVLFTHDPHKSTPDISLYGEFTTCSQGEDIAAGLVYGLPITEYHRKNYHYGADISLESAFPNIYQKLVRLSTELVQRYGFGHQELEFTFESEQPGDLYILQTRTQDIEKRDKRYVFTTPSDQMSLVGRGIGIGGGAMSGRVAIDMDGLKIIAKKYPKEKRILVRPDTVPDDVSMVFNCDGLLTGRGGATSHAAVTAVRLGKACVVGCRDLSVNEKEKWCTISDIKFSTGDEISIESSLGNIYAGHYPTKYIEVS